LADGGKSAAVRCDAPGTAAHVPRELPPACSAAELRTLAGEIKDRAGRGAL